MYECVCVCQEESYQKHRGSSQLANVQHRARCLVCLPYLAEKVIFRGTYKEISAGHNRGVSRMTQGGGDISVIFYVHDIF